MIRALRSLHNDTRGAIGILVLLTIWCLVGLLAMLWNTAEYAARRQQVQNAADSAAHAAATWSARCVNLTAAQNMLIAQDGSAEVISRAALPTDNSLQNEINREYLLIINPNLKTLRSRLPGLLANIEKNYALLTAAFQTVQTDAGSIAFPNQKALTDYQTQLRQAAFAINWAEGVYVQGGATSGSNPGPPGGSGQGLQQLVAKFTDETLTTQMRDAIIASLEAQGPPTVAGVPQTPGVLQNFQTQTAPATGAAVWNTFQTNQQKLFAEEQAFATEFPISIDDQLTKLADYYKVTYQLTNHIVPAIAADDPQNPSIPVTHSIAQAPVITQAAVDPTAGLDHTDTIRATYGGDLEAQFGVPFPTTVTIDPINPNTGFYQSDGDATLNLKFVDPGSEILFPRQTIDTGIPQVATVTINCNPRFGGWGHAWIFPIERYFGTRVSNDMQGLQSQFFQNGSTGIDDLRLQLAKLLDQLAGITDFNIPDPATTLRDTQIDPSTKQLDSIRVLPTLTIPTTDTASSSIRTNVDFTYRNAANSYIASVRRLAAIIRQYGAFYNVFTVPIAVPTWNAKIDNATIIVAQELGQAETPDQQKDPTKGFMVLSTYQLWNKQAKALPPNWWATSNLQESLRSAILTEIITYNISAVGARFFSAGVPNPYGVAREVIADSPEINNAAIMIAAEMVSRPWPYEKTPPDLTVPPVRGMMPNDRKEFFSYLVSAHNSDTNAVKPLLSSIFGTSPNVVAYAQAEACNWMEFNDSYGGFATERFDEVSGNESSGWQPAVSGLLACPRAWRTASIGGWNWRARLATADMIGQAYAQDPTFAATLQDASITATGDDAATNALSQINMH